MHIFLLGLAERHCSSGERRMGRTMGDQAMIMNGLPCVNVSADVPIGTVRFESWAGPTTWFERSGRREWTASSSLYQNVTTPTSYQHRGVLLLEIRTVVNGAHTSHTPFSFTICSKITGMDRESHHTLPESRRRTKGS